MILTVIGIFTKYSWAIPLKSKSGLSVTNGFKTIIWGTNLGGWNPEKLWVDRGREFYKKIHLNLYLKDMKANNILLKVF